MTDLDPLAFHKNPGLTKLLPEHLAMLREESAIADEVILARGYSSVTDPETRWWRLNGAELALPLGVEPREPSMWIPLLDPSGRPHGFQVRIFGGVWRSWDGSHTAKYVNPVGQPNRLDWGPGVWDRLQADPTLEVLVTEGVKKVDAGVSAGLAVVGLVGVDSWRGRPPGADGLVDRNADVAPIPDLALLAGRPVVIGYDSDWVTNRNVHRAAGALARHLTKLGATVRFLVLPPAADGRKQGLDDYLAAGGTAASVRALYRKSLPPYPKPDPVKIALGGGLIGDSADLPRAVVLCAEAFAADAADQLMHVQGVGWHWWDGRRWNAALGEARALDAVRAWLTERIAEMAAAKATIAAAKQRVADGGPARTPAEVQFELDAGPVIALGAAAQRCTGTLGSVTGVRDLARATELLRAAPADLDACPYLLNVSNGVLDLRDMSLSEPDPAAQLTKVTRAAWHPLEPATGMAYWLEFLERVIPDEGVRRFLQEIVGDALLGEVRSHVLPILYGDETGANGKSTFLNAVQFALGDYAVQLNPEVLLDQGTHGSHPTERMTLLGARFAAATETDRSRRWNESLVKGLTGGDPIRARRMRQDEVTFMPSHTIFLATNYMPRVTDQGRGAIWRRLVVIPFTASIPRADQDVHLEETLRLSADAVLEWAVEGFERVALRGGDLLRPGSVPAAVLERTEAYRAEADTVGRFLAECTRVTGSTSTRALPGRTLYDSYVEWCKEEGGIPRVKRKPFYAVIEALDGVTRGITDGSATFRGIELSEGAPMPFGL